MTDGKTDWLAANITTSSISQPTRANKRSVLSVQVHIAVRIQNEWTNRRTERPAQI